MDQTQFKKLSQEIAQGMRRDQEGLRHRLQRLHRSQWPEATVATELATLQTQVTASRQAREQRLAALPTVHYPDDLPVAQQRAAIAQILQKHAVVVLCGATGSGKTTQLPKICLELQRGTAGWIGITQPRRIAARSIAAFLAQDLRTTMGAVVGYKMRFTDHVTPESYIKVMTDGLLLAEIQSDRLLTQYDTLIIDEAHERSLNIDFILGYLRQLLPKRPDLKVIISSATLDTERFSSHFGNAPAIEVSGRTFPVETRYRPLHPLETTDQEGESVELDLEQGILLAIHELFALGPNGDVLLFLPGEREIRELSTCLRQQALPNVEILPLFARLSMAEQQRIFHPGSRRRIILATNVAETSITVPGIRYVVDSGLARISRHSGRTQVRRLPVEKISRAAADQRQGRCGRLADGVCIRLFSEEEYRARPAFTDPEIRRASLAAVILQMKFLQIGTIETFPFVDPPTTSAIGDGMRLLAELDAVSPTGQLTPIGLALAQLPLEPRLGRMLLAGQTHHCLDAMLVIVSAISLPDPREWPEAKRGLAEIAHKRHLHPQSDFLGILNLWLFIQAGQEEAGSNAPFRRFLKENYLSVVRVREWLGIHEQLSSLTQKLYARQNTTGNGTRHHQANKPINSSGSTSGGTPGIILDENGFRAIHLAILAGSLGFIGFKTENHDYVGARQTRFVISSASVLSKKSPPWVVAGELTETTRLFASVCARIEPEWIETVAGKLCRRTHYDPHWEKKVGAAAIYERVTLLGLTLLTRRKVALAPIDPLLARKIFIQSALVEGQWQATTDFLAHNQGLLAEIRELEHKSRRRDLLVDEQDLYAFYDERIPAHVHDAHRFQKWYWQARQQQARLLYFSRDLLLRQAEEGISGDSYPGHLMVHGQALSLEYHFNPGGGEGGGEDGISVGIPLPLLNQVPAAVFEWLVPGLLPNKIVAMLKTLPKTVRRPLVPLPQTCQICLENFQDADRQQPLAAVLGRIIQQRYGVTVPPTAWRLADLPEHLRINFKVLDEQTGKVLAQGRELAELQQQYGAVARSTFKQLSQASFERTGLSNWDFGELPPQVVIPGRGGGAVYGFPALQDDGQTVSLRLFDSPEQAQQVNRWGMVRLFALQLPQQLRLLEKTLPLDRTMLLAYAPFGRREVLVQELLMLAVARVFLDGESEEMTTTMLFQKRLQAGRSRLTAEATAVHELVRRLLEHYQAILGTLRTMQTPGLQKWTGEIRVHLDSLVFPGFLRATPPVWLRHVPRYLQAIRLRLERRVLDPQKDAQKAAELWPLWQQYQMVAKQQIAANRQDPELQYYRWLLEEYRVSLFAQDLRTSVPVSAKRLQSQWEKVLR